MLRVACMFSCGESSAVAVKLKQAELRGHLIPGGRAREMLYRVTAQSFTTSHRIAKAVQAESPEAALRLVSNELADAGYYALDARPDQQSAIAAPAPLRDYAAFLLGVLEFRCTKAAAIARSPAPDCKELAAAIGSLMGIVDELIARNLLDPAEIRWCRQQAAPAVRATYCDADRRSAA